MKGLGELKPVYDFLQDRAGEYYSPEEIANKKISMSWVPTKEDLLIV